MSVSIAADIGPVVTGAHVERAVLTTLHDWLPSYIRECEEKAGGTRGDLPLPRGWLVTGRELDKFTSDQLPCIIVMAGGIVLKPLSQGYPGSTACTWVLDVGTIWNAAWGRLSREHAQLYARAISLTLMQRPLQGVAGVVDMTGESYDEVDFSDTRTYSAAVCRFTIEVEDVYWRSGGPPPYVEPPSDPDVPWEPWATVRETGVTVVNHPVDSPLTNGGSP